MKKAIKKAMHIIQVISTAGCFLIGCLGGAIYEIVGHKKFEELLSTFGIFNGMDTFVYVCVILIVLVIITCFINSKIQ